MIISFQYQYVIYCCYTHLTTWASVIVTLCFVLSLIILSYSSHSLLDKEHFHLNFFFSFIFFYTYRVVLFPDILLLFPEIYIFIHFYHVYGAQGWHFKDKAVKEFQTMWNRCVRKVLTLLYETRRHFLPHLIRTTSASDQIFSRFLKMQTENGNQCKPPC